LFLCARVWCVQILFILLWIGLVGFTGTKRENPLIRWTWKLHILHPNAGRKSTKSLKRKSKKALKIKSKKALKRKSKKALKRKNKPLKRKSKKTKG
jgi:hypothetical protein